MANEMMTFTGENDAVVDAAPAVTYRRLADGAIWPVCEAHKGTTRAAERRRPKGVAAPAMGVRCRICETNDR